MIPFTQFQVVPQVIPTNRIIYRIFALDENGIIWVGTVQEFQLDSERPIPDGNLQPGMQGVTWKKVPPL